MRAHRGKFPGHAAKGPRPCHLNPQAPSTDLVGAGAEASQVMLPTVACTEWLGLAESALEVAGLAGVVNFRPSFIPSFN